MTAKQGVPLARAAMRLAMSRERVMRRILCGTLQAAKDAEGRWLVDEESLEAYRKAVGAGSTPHGAPRAASA
jgi:hypothetical protein